MIDRNSMFLGLKAYQRAKLEEQGIADAAQQAELLENDETVSAAMTEISQIDAKALPSVISQQFTKIAALEEKVKKAQKSAERVKERADNAQNYNAFWRKKAAIEALQDATVEIAEAEGDIIDAMNVSFEYQQQLGQIAQYLFMLGVSNIAATRTVVQQLRLELQKAPQEKMSDLAKSEILAVIRQLEAQEDMAQKQEKQAQALQKHKELITEGIEKDKEQDKVLAQMKDSDDKQDKLIAEGVEKDKSQDNRISENARDIDKLEKQDIAQDRLIAEGVEKDKTQDKIIAEMQGVNEKQDVLIAQNFEINQKQEDRIEDIVKENQERKDALEQQKEEIEALKEKLNRIETELVTQDNRILPIASAIVSAAALILSVLQFFI